MRRRRVALLGFGNVAVHGHLPTWQARRDVEIVAVADPQAERRDLAARYFPSAGTYADAEALLARERVDFVVIAAPPAFHAPLAAMAAAAGCQVLCEKPVATSLAEYRPAARQSHERGLTLYTVHNWKHSCQFRQAMALLTEGAIGHLRTARFFVARRGAAVTVDRDWREDSRLAGGGILVDHGWHAFYLMLNLFGTSPTVVRARACRQREPRGAAEDTAVCRVEFPGGSAELWLTWAASERYTAWHLEGDEGRLSLVDDWMLLRRGSTVERFRLPSSLSAGSHHPDWFAAVVDDFLREVDETGSRGANLAEAEACLVLTTLAYASAAAEAAPQPVPAGFPWPAPAPRLAFGDTA